MITAEAIMNFLSIWGITGISVAIIFLTFGIDRIDEDARDAYPFRILLIPGIILIWPLVLLRWVKLELKLDNSHARHQPPREAHLSLWIVLALTITLLFGSAIYFRSEIPSDFKPVKVTPKADT